MITNEEVYVSIDRGYEQDVECTICEGTGRIEVWSDYADSHVECTCVRCHGEGTIEMYVEDEVREWVEVEGKRTLRAYNEGYELYEDHIIIEVDLEHIRENRASHGIKYQIV
jgi:Zn ribbon nucleic-acid-binding protein